MVLKTLEMRRFFSTANSIKSNSILPVLAYIRVNNDRIEKTNLNAYCVMNITPVGDTILIDEKILSAIVKVTTSDTIEVKVKGDKVHLSDGVNKMSFLLSAEEHYPQFPDSEKENEVVLKQDVLEAIGIASKNVAVNDVAPAYNFVNVAHGYVAASDRAKLYLKKFDGLPTLLIDTLAANIISQFGEVTCYQRGNYTFYHVGSFLFGFAQSEGKPVDYGKFLADVQKEEYMEVICNEIYSFCDLFMASSSSESVTMDFDGNKLSFYDADREVANEITLNVVGDYKPKVSFLPRLLNSLLKSIGAEKIRMSKLKTQPGVTFWDAEDENMYAILGVASK